MFSEGLEQNNFLPDIETFAQQFLIIDVEYFLRKHESQLVLCQAGDLDKTNEEENYDKFGAITRDRPERKATIDVS